MGKRLWLLLAALAVGGLAAAARGQSIELPQQMKPHGAEVALQPSPTVATVIEPPDAAYYGPVLEPPGVAYTQDPLPVPPGGFEPWTWQWLPDSLIYHSYLAGPLEPRFAGIWAYEDDRGWFQDVTLGGRVGIVRYGTQDELWPQGWQLDVEGAAFPRINLEENWDLDSSDFRFGVPLTYGIGRYQTKFAIYHLSSHIGDEFLIRNGTFTRINYARDVFVWGHSYYPTDSFRVYGEAGYAFHNDGGSRPWEFQFGFEWSPLYPTGRFGAPFLAANGHLREEVDFGGNLVVQTGWQWRSTDNRRLFRAGLQFFNGKSNQHQFFDESQQYVGFGLWYDY